MALYMNSPKGKFADIENTVDSLIGRSARKRGYKIIHYNAVDKYYKMSTGEEGPQAWQIIDRDIINNIKFKKENEMKSDQLKKMIKEEIHSTLTEDKMKYEIGVIIATELPELIGAKIDNISSQLMEAINELYIPKNND